MSAWEHVSLIIAGVLAVIIGALDMFLYKSHLTVQGDVALISTGFIMLTGKGLSIPYLS